MYRIQGIRFLSTKCNVWRRLKPMALIHCGKQTMNVIHIMSMNSLWLLVRITISSFILGLSHWNYFHHHHHHIFLVGLHLTWSASSNQWLALDIIVVAWDLAIRKWQAQHKGSTVGLWYLWGIHSRTSHRYWFLWILRSAESPQRTSQICLEALPRA